jgi:hypothetical protein
MLSGIANNVPKREFMKIGACWCEWSKVAPRGVSGYPMFFSANLVHKDDMPFLLAEIENLDNALGHSESPEPGNNA